MTAPDVNADVRARFEAWARSGIAASYGNTFLRPEWADGYPDRELGAAWLAWQAAHADLTGEVRELVEGASEALDALHAHGVSEKCRAWIPSRDNTALNGLRAALAKHTHQEKP